MVEMAVLETSHKGLQATAKHVFMKHDFTLSKIGSQGGLLIEN